MQPAGLFFLRPAVRRLQLTRPPAWPCPSGSCPCLGQALAACPPIYSTQPHHTHHAYTPPRPWRCWTPSLARAVLSGSTMPTRYYHSPASWHYPSAYPTRGCWGSCSMGQSSMGRGARRSGCGGCSRGCRRPCARVRRAVGTQPGGAGQGGELAAAMWLLQARWAQRLAHAHAGCAKRWSLADRTYHHVQVLWIPNPHPAPPQPHPAPPHPIPQAGPPGWSGPLPACAAAPSGWDRRPSLLSPFWTWPTMQ